MFTQKVKSGNRAIATLAKFDTTYAKVEAFIKFHYKVNDIPLKNIKPSFVDDFEHYLMVKTAFSIIP